MRWLLSLAAVVAALAVVPVPAFAQSRAQVDEYLKEQKRGVESIQGSKYDEGAAAFKHCLELLPKDATSAYNLACIHSLRSELDAAFDWLGKAVDWGFGAIGDEEMKLLETKDTDLTNLRRDPRFAAAVEKLKARRKTVADFVAKPEIYVPAALKDAERVPLLVVLHDAGQTPVTALASGPWKRLADELGFALLLPSAAWMVESDPAKGMQWFDTWFTYGEKPWQYEKSVSAAVDLFKKSHKVDADRMYILGQGQGGMVAYNVAVCAPGSYKGVVVYGAMLLGGKTTAARSRTAAKSGMKARLLVPDTQVYGPMLEANEIDKETGAIGQLFKDWGMEGGVDRFQRKSDDPDQAFTLISAAVKSFLPPPEPPPAPAEPPTDKEKDGNGNGR